MKLMLQQHLEYAGPSLPRRDPLLSIRFSALLFWIALGLLAVTIAAMGLPYFRPFYGGSAIRVATRCAEFVVFYGRWISALFALVAVPSRWLFGAAGWPSRVATCIAVALLIFYWLFAPGDGAYSRMLYGSC